MSLNAYADPDLRIIHEEPAIFNGVCRVIRTPEQVLSYMQSSGALLGNETDEEIIDQYVSLHWAWIVRKDECR